MKDKPKKTFKEINGETRVGSFLRKLNLGELAQEALQGDIIGVVSSILNTGKLTPEQKEEALNLHKLDLQDVQDARDLQKVALQQDDLFSKRFIYYLSVGVFSFAAIVLIMLFFVEIPEKNRDVINFILGVVIGTGLTGIFNYFFGSSKGSKDKQELINTLR